MSKEDHFLIVWEVTCLNPEEGRPAKFLVVDEGDDPNFYCDGCGAEGNHLPHVTDKTEMPCQRCKGLGKIKNFREDNVVCSWCKGTGIYKFSHIMRLIGRVYEKDLRKLAEKDPREWR